MCVETRVEGRKNEEKVVEKQRERRGPKRRNTERERLTGDYPRGSTGRSSEQQQRVAVVVVGIVGVVGWN